MFLSIITPSFNRAYILGQCYQSLLSQSDQDFEWIVVDDGSSDGTGELIKQYINQKLINIRYVYQENGGKHRAHNTGVQVAQGEMVVCLDSDDQLSEDAVQTAHLCWGKIKGKCNGILAKRGDIKTGSPICGSWPGDLLFSTMTDMIDLYSFQGDTVLFFDTELLKRHPFREFQKEKFLPEMNLYCELDQYGKMYLVDRVLYRCEYLPDGLTAKYHKLLKENPNGTSDTYYRQMLLAKQWKNRIKYAVLTVLYMQLSSDTSELYFSDFKILIFVLRFPVKLFHRMIFRRLERSVYK